MQKEKKKKKYNLPSAVSAIPFYTCTAASYKSEIKANWRHLLRELSLCYASMNDSLAKNSLDLHRNVLRDELMVMVRLQEREPFLFSQINTWITYTVNIQLCCHSRGAVCLKVRAPPLTSSQIYWLIEGHCKYLSLPKKKIKVNSWRNADWL